MILTDEVGNIVGSRNLNDAKIEMDTDLTYLKQQLEKMKGSYPPVVIDLALYSGVELDEEGFMPEGENIKQYMYYSDSWMLRQLKIYPFVQLCIISLFWPWLTSLLVPQNGGTKQGLAWNGKGNGPPIGNTPIVLSRLD